MRRYFIAFSRVPRHPPVVTDPHNPGYSVRLFGSEVATGRHNVYAEIRHRSTQFLVGAGVNVTAAVTAGDGSFWASGAAFLNLDTLSDGTTKFNINESQTVQFDPATGVTVTYTAPDGSTDTYTVEGVGSGTPDYTITNVGGTYEGEPSDTITATVKVVDASTSDPVENVQVAIASGYPSPSGSATGGVTDSSGEADISWTLGPTEATYTLRVTTPDSGDTLDLSATAEIDTGGGGTGSIPLTTFRFAGTNEDVSFGIPLLEGQVMPNDVDECWIEVGGNEVQSYLEALVARHSDGSVRWLLAQFDPGTLAVGASGSAILHFSGSTLSRLSKASVDWSSAPGSTHLTIGFPYAICYPSAAHMCASGCYGPNLRPAGQYGPTTYGETQFGGGGWPLAQLDTYYGQRATHWYNNWSGSTGQDFNYDYSFQALRYFARTAQPEYVKYALALAMGKRKGSSNYGQTHFAMWGKAMHYLLTGDTASRDHVFNVYVDYADRPTSGVWTDMHNSPPNTSDTEGRPVGHIGMILAVTMPQWLNRTTGMPSGHADYGSVWDAWIANLLSANGWGLAKTLTNGTVNDPGSTGAWSTYNSSTAVNGPTVVVFHNGLICQSLQWYYDYRTQDATVLAKIKSMLDWAWSVRRSNMVADSSTVKTENLVFAQFFYQNATQTAGGGPNCNTTNNGFWPGQFAWYYSKTGDTTYRDRADILAKTIFNGVSGCPDNTTTRGVNNARMREFNEVFFSIADYLSLR